MINLTTQEGHKVIVGPDPQGVIFMVAPSGPQLDEGINDMFTVGLRFSSILRSLAEMATETGYRTDDGHSAMFLRQDALELSLRYQHRLDQHLVTRLTVQDTEKVIRYLRSLTEGGSDRIESSHDIMPAPRRKLGRNKPCPCGSGKKYKKCCGAPSAKPPPIPNELEPFSHSDDKFVQALLREAALDISALSDAEFWHDLGRALGTSEFHELAIKAFDRALVIRPSDELSAANRAVSIGAMGSPEDCLRILQTLPNQDGKVSVLIANTLQELRRDSEAIPYYEKAIAVEPDFYLPVRRLIETLAMLDHPLLEYWINRAVKQFPTSPAIASTYCWYLLRANRLEELAEAEWIDHLEADTSPERVIGRRSEDPKLIVEAQLFRLIGLAIHNENAEFIEKGIKILQAAPADWHLCNPAHNLAYVAANLGRRDLVVTAGCKFCEKCGSDKASLVYFQEQLARASCFAKDYTTALTDCETGLKLDADCKGLLWTQSWSLDELGQTEEAIKAAQHLYKLEPKTDNLAYNLGFMCGRVAKLGLAAQYYESQIHLKPDHFQAIENLTPLRLMEGEPARAADLFATWIKIVELIADPEALQRKKATFSELHKFTLEHKGSPTLALEVKERNLSLDPKLGAETAIPLKRPSHEELLAAMRNNDAEEVKDISFRFEMEKRGDFSPLAEKVASAFPEVKLLPLLAYRSFLEGERLLDDFSRIDYSPAVLAFAKALEITLKSVVFDSFRQAIVSAPDFAGIMADASNKSFKDAQKFASFAKNGTYYELGTMAHTLKLCSEPIGGTMKLLIRFKVFVDSHLRLKNVLEPQQFKAISDLAKNYRNPAAHSQTFDRAAATHVKNTVIPLLKVILIPSS